MDIIATLKACIETMERISISGFDNADRYVGVMATLKRLVAKLQSDAKNMEERKEDKDG